MVQRTVWRKKNCGAAFILIVLMIGSMLSGVSARPINEGTAMDGERPVEISILWDLGYLEREEAAKSLEYSPELWEMLAPENYHNNAEWLQWMLPLGGGSDPKIREMTVEELEASEREALGNKIRRDIPKEMFQFIKLSEPLGLTTRELDFILMDTPLEGLGDAFKEGAGAGGVNELYLITEALWEIEQNNPGSPEGTVVQYVAGSSVEPQRVYNLLGIHPDSELSPYEYAYENNWFSPKDALADSAKWIREDRFSAEGGARDTFFKEAWQLAEDEALSEEAITAAIDKQLWQREKMDQYYATLNLFTYFFEVPEIRVSAVDYSKPLHPSFQGLLGEGLISYWPVPGQRYISSPFGMRRDPFGQDWRFHRGIDIPQGMEKPIIAAKSGLVTISHKGGSYGHWIEIDHGEGWTTRYAHNSRNLVEAGQKVEKGQVIALIGSTGRSTGPHLHFEVRKYGEAVNPLEWLEMEEYEPPAEEVVTPAAKENEEAPDQTAEEAVEDTTEDSVDDGPEEAVDSTTGEGAESAPNETPEDSEEEEGEQ